MKVTVVVPSYNSEKVLKKCLDSILGQTLEDFEVIVVDDGSTDNTVAMANEYAEKDSRVTVIPKEHENAGVSRNVGIEKAQGDYLVFWDSDDYFELNALELLYNKCIEYDADICICDAWHFDHQLKLEKDGLKLNPDYLPEKRPFSKDDIPDTIYNLTANVPWNKMFKRQFLLDKNIRFQSLPKANDTCFNLVAMAMADKIVTVDDKLIHWRFNQKAVSTTTDASRSSMCVFWAFEEAYRILSERGVYDKVKISFLNKALGSYLYVLSCQKGTEGLENFRNVYNYIRTDAFKKLGFDEVVRDQIHNQNKYERYLGIKNGTYEEYLLWRENRDIKEVRRSYVSDVKELNAQLKELRAEKKALEKSYNKLSRDYDRINSSVAYNVGMKVTWLPRKINSAIKKDNKGSK